MKKLLLSIGSLAATAAPVATVVACGTKIKVAVLADKPKTTSFVDSAGNGFDSEELNQGVQDTWGTDSVVTQSNTGAPVTYKPITDENGKVLRYKFKRWAFGTIIERNKVIDEDRNGAVVGVNIQAQDVYVDMDDELSTQPEYQDGWDAEKMQMEVPSRTNTYAIMTSDFRSVRHFEGMRIAVKDYAAAATDGLVRIIDTTSITDDEAGDKLRVKTYQGAINSLIKFKDVFAKGTPAKFISTIIDPDANTSMSNVLSFTGSDKASSALQDGQITRLNQVDVFGSIDLPDGVEGFVHVKGAIVTPIANGTYVQFPAKTGSTKDAFEFAVPKKPGQIFPERIIALGDPAKINA